MELLREVYQPGAMGPPVQAFTQTEERGEFRFADVPPGRYYVRAISSAMPLRLPDTGERARYTLTYFPNTPDLRSAQRVLVSPGQDVGGITFALGTAEPVTVRGSLVGADSSAARARVALTSLRGMAPTSLTGAIDSEGNFEIGDVLPGSYTLRVSTPTSTRDIGSGLPSLLTRTVQVFAGMDELTLVAERPGRLEGTVLSDDRAPLPFDLNGLVVRVPAALSEGRGFGRVAVGADGAFDFEAMSGTSSLTVVGYPDGWAVSRIRVDGVELTGSTLDIPSEGRQRLEIVLTNHLGSVAGRVTTADGDSVPDALVVLFPTRRDRWGTSRFTHTTFTALDGTYTFEGLVPSEYQAIAVGTLPSGAWIDPVVLGQLWIRSTSVQVFGDEAHALSLRLMPGPDLEP